MRLAYWLLLMGKRGEAGKGWSRAWVRLLTVAMVHAVEDELDIGTLEGSHARVLTM